MSALGTKIPHAVLCNQKERKMDGRERDRERGTKGRRGSVLYKALRAFTRSDLFIFFGKNFIGENCPDFIGNVKPFFVRHIWSCK